MPSVQTTTSRDNFRGKLVMFDIRRYRKYFYRFSYLQKKKRLRATDVWFQDMLEIVAIIRY